MGKNRERYTVEMLGNPLERPTGGFGDAIAVYSQGFNIGVDIDTLGKHKLKILRARLRDHVYNLVADEIKRRTGRCLEELNIVVYTNNTRRNGLGEAIVVIHPKILIM